MTYQHESVVALLEERFPALADDLHDEIAEGLLHIQIGAFSDLAQQAIDAGDDSAWKRVVDVFVEVWRDCSPAVRNALNVSFLEHLNFEDGKRKRAWAYKAMPPAMQRGYDEMEAYNRKIHGDRGPRR